MSTYVISDIHGHLEAFKSMLKEIDFKYDGTDSIHILGDMVDWGRESIATLLYVRELDLKYDFVYVYKGNHELMLEELIEESSTIWVELWFGNGQEITVEQYKECDKQTRMDIYNYIKNLKYFRDDIVVNNQAYYLSHAALSNNLYTKEERDEHIVWDRYESGVNPFGTLPSDQQEQYKDHIFIGGHTIVKSYNSVTPEKDLKIYKDIPNRYINIDCGAKMQGKKIRGYGCRLACLCLDTLEEYYI